MNLSNSNLITGEEPVFFSSPLKRVLVTGGTGFLGAYIIKNLVEKNVAVTALRRSSITPFFIPESIWDRVAWVDGDVLDVVSLEDAMRDVDGVIHAAALVSFHKAQRSQMYQVNVEGTANVINAAIDQQVTRFVHVSSVAALGRKTKSELASEEKKWEEDKNNTHYAISKHKAELEVWRGFAEGLSGAIINPSAILGFGNWHQSSSAIFKSVYKEFPWYTQGINGFVGVEDVAEAAVQVLFSEIHGKRFVVNAENIYFRDLFNTIADGFGKHKPSRKATPLLGELAWRMEALKTFFTGQKPLLTRETAKIAHSLTRFDNSTLLKALPQFQYAPINKVVKDACKAYMRALQMGQLTL